MNTAKHPPRRTGYSLIEILLVLAIMGILAAVAVSQLGNPPGNAVRSIVDELEGAITNAHKATVATGRDTSITTWGTWSQANPLVLAQGDATLTSTNIQNVASQILAGNPPTLSNPPTPAEILNASVAVDFRFRPVDRTNTRARVVLAGSGDWGTAMTAFSGRTSDDISSVAPFLAGQPLSGVISDANNLFTGGIRRVVISGTNKRFDTTFVIQVVGINSQQEPIAGGPMGLLVVQANGASVYKFYNPGVRYGDGKWRRL